MKDTKKKKILYVITKSNFGGAQRYVYELATSLPKDLFEVCVAFGGSGVLKEKLERAGMVTRTIIHFERDVSILREIGALMELYKIVKELQPDIVHLNSSKAGGVGVCVARLCHIRRIIFTAHGWPFREQRSFLWRSLVWFFSYLTALLSQVVIVVSESDATHSYMPFIKKKLVCIPTGVSEFQYIEKDDARAYLIPEEIRIRHAQDLFVVSTGEHTLNKNLYTLLHAIEKHNLQQVQKIFLVLIGDGEERVGLESYVQKHHLEESVYFTGYVDEVRTYLKAFDIFVLPSLKEGTPYGLLEAGALGLAVIASDVGGIPKIITNGKNGLLIDPTDPTSLIEALERYTVYDTLREEHGEQLMNTIHTHYTKNSMLSRTQELYTC